MLISRAIDFPRLKSLVWQRISWVPILRFVSRLRLRRFLYELLEIGPSSKIAALSFGGGALNNNGDRATVGSPLLHLKHQLRKTPLTLEASAAPGIKASS